MPHMEMDVVIFMGKGLNHTWTHISNIKETFRIVFYEYVSKLL